VQEFTSELALLKSCCGFWRCKIDLFRSKKIC